MKIRYLLLFIGIIVANTSKSQEYNYGISAGIDVVQLFHNKSSEFYLSNSDPMLSFNVNGFFELKSSKVFGTSIEPGFIQKGGKSDASPRYKLNYIQLPMLAEFFFTDKFYLSIGPEMSYLISKRLGSTNLLNPEDIRFELSGILGLNFRMINKIDIGLAYSHGFTNVDKIIFTNKYDQILGEIKEYNHYLQLKLRYRL